MQWIKSCIPGLWLGIYSLPLQCHLVITLSFYIPSGLGKVSGCHCNALSLAQVLGQRGEWARYISLSPSPWYLDCSSWRAVASFPSASAHMCT